MACITEEVAVIEQQQGWEHLFIDIKKSSQYDLTCKAAKLQENRDRNRYRDVSPFDHSRVKLQDGPSDYINSSLVEVTDADRRYILSQGPLPGTSGHLWQMVWEQNSKAVIMLNKTIERGMSKCHQYWPIDKNYPVTYHQDGYIVTLVSETDMQNFVIREFELHRIKSRETRTVYHFHYTAWPDFDVPQSPAAFLNFLASIRQYGVLDNHWGPAVIHCSAGIGRSGTFILIDACLELLQKNVPFGVREVLLELRKFRMGLIQTPQQLRFSYFAIAECERILLFKQSEENGYSDTDAMSDDSEVYDQLYRDNNEIFDADKFDDDSCEEEFSEHTPLQVDNGFNPQQGPISDTEKQMHCCPNKHETLAFNNNIKSETIPAFPSDATTDASIETAVLDSEEIQTNEPSETVSTSDDEPLSLITDHYQEENTEQQNRKSNSNHDELNAEAKDEKNFGTPALSQNAHPEKMPKPHTLTTQPQSNHINSENNLRKRTAESTDISDSNKNIQITDSKSECFEEKSSWKPYIMGGCMLIALGLIASIYSKV